MAVKVNRSEVPLFVVGLGGTGKDIARAIKLKFQERFNDLDPNNKMPPHTAFLVLDDDNTGIDTDPEGLVPADFHRLRVDNIRGIFTNRTFTQYEREWINPELSTVGATDGAGGVRQIGRFQLYRNIDEIASKISTKLNAILAHSPSTPPSAASMNVLICGSLSGGTGSGTALDTAYIVHQIISNEHAAYAADMKMYGMFIMPENILKKVDLDTTRKEELQANAYAAMKEIDYWMRHPQHKQSLLVNYSGAFSAEWNHRPFSYLGYIGHSWEDGVAITNPYAGAVNKVAELMLLLSADTSKADKGGLVQHSIYSNLSNVDIHMATLQGVAPYPVSINAMSLGMSEYSSDEVGISDYEKEKTLELAMDVPTFSIKTNEPMSRQDAELTGTEIVEGVLSLEKYIEEFFDNLRIGIQPVDDYRNGMDYPILDFSNRAAITAAGQSYSSQIKNHYTGILPSTRDYFVDYFNKVWGNFVPEAKNKIKDPNCGPIGFLHFLDQVYMPDLDAAFSESTAIVKDSPQIIAERAEACDLAYEEALKFHVIPGTAQSYMDNYRARSEELCDACIDHCIHRAKQEALKPYIAKIQAYRDNLEVLIEALKLKIKDCENKEIKTELVGGDLTFAQLKKYLDGSIADPQMLQQRNDSIAKARDAVLDRLADDSFALPRDKTATTYSAKEKMKTDFIEMVNEFVEDAFSRIGLDNLDLVLEAASSIAGQDKVKYMTNVVAPRMAAAAKPMLQLKTSYRNSVKDYCNFHHTAVPRNAVIIQQGLTAYHNAGAAQNNNQADYTSSDITDRMIHVHMRLGIPLYLMNDVYKLRENYEAVLSRTSSDPCMGIHLVNKIKTFNGLRNGKAYSLRDTWLKLPSPIPPVEIEPDQMSNSEKGTVEYLEELLTKAVESGIVTYGTIGGVPAYDGYTENAFLSNEILQINGLRIGENNDAVMNMHVEEIKKHIQDIADDETQTEENRLTALHAMRKNNILRDVRYGEFINNYAHALNRQPVIPSGGNSPAEKDQIAENYFDVRSKLCAWLLSMYPECLCLVEKNLEAFAFLHEKEQALQAKIDKKNRLYDLAGMFAIPFTASKLLMDVTTFEIENKNKTMVSLFDNDMEKFSVKEITYWEAALLMQYEEHEEKFSPAVRQLIEEMAAKYPPNFKTLRDTKVLSDVEDKLEGVLKHWNDLLMDIRSDVDMNIQRRDTIISIYERLIKAADGVKQAYDLWKQKPTGIPVTASQPETKPVETAKKEQSVSATEATAYPPEFVEKIAAMPHAAKIAMLKQIPEEKRLILIAQLPVDQIAAIMAELG